MNFHKEINPKLLIEALKVFDPQPEKSSKSGGMLEILQMWLRIKQAFDKCISARDVLDMQTNLSDLKQFVEKEENVVIQNESRPKNSYTKYPLYNDPDNKYDIFLIDWGEGSVSKYHDHSHGGCAMFVVKGMLLESRISSKFGISKSYLPEGTVSYIDNNIGYHKIKAFDRSLSLHIYFPGGVETNYF